ncbi:MAG: arsenic efflux protein [Candidatus Nealsonbacteria bacterium]|nr:arsenic efflux protein [Candidatus Nealsonbacteria bacterium]
MQGIFLDALIDSVKMIPFLLAVYIGIELVEYKFGDKIRKAVQKAGAAGPLIGAIAGSFPQCGFSVIAAALYTQRLATIGTLLAVFISTSDEAIPVILSQPEKAYVILPLVLTKIFIALIAGYAIDFLFRKKNQKILAHIKDYESGKDDLGHHHELIADKHACCGHNISPNAKEFNPKEIFLHPAIHTLKIFLFIFIISFSINFAVFQIGEENFGKIFLGNNFLQPIIAAIIGLIPNCAASVAIAELYLKGLITYGSVIAGLCASGGLGLIVLFKEEKSRRNVFTVISLLFGISVFSGLIVQYFF